MLGQRRSEDGANEIETIPELLEMLTLEGCIVTIDAMGCQTDVAEAIIDAEADYVLRLKDNHSGLRADVERLFERRLGVGFDPGHTDVDTGHGRVETRRCWAVDVAGKGLVDESRWPGLQSVALVETERFVAEPQEAKPEAGLAEGETETERRYLISSLEADAEKILEASRRHWQIENGLHWVLDVAFEEDHSQVRTQNAAENLALVRRLVASAVKQDDRIDAGTKNKRKRAGWDDDYREHLLQNL
jgi:predicted transposase YbfD/YdcC